MRCPYPTTSGRWAVVGPIGAPMSHPRHLPDSTELLLLDVVVDKRDGLADHLSRPIVVVSLPEHQSLFAARDLVEECVSAIAWKDLVSCHVQHEDLRLV